MWGGEIIIIDIYEYMNMYIKKKKNTVKQVDEEWNKNTRQEDDA